MHNPEALIEVEKKVSAAGHDAGKTKATLWVIRVFQIVANIEIINTALEWQH